MIKKGKRVKPFFKNCRILVQGCFLRCDWKFKNNASTDDILNFLKEHGINIESFTCKVCGQKFLRIDQSIEKNVCLGCYSEIKKEKNKK